MSVGDWSATDLCTDKDLVDFESNALDWVKSRGTGSHWRGTAKTLIGNRLESQLRDVELSTDVDEVLDLISNPEVLREAAVFLSLHLIANDKMVHSADTWAAKAVSYKDLFDDEFPIAVSRLHVDKDESGTIEDVEKYSVNLGVTLTRGA